ncbi:MAG: hypothetical protein HDT27_08055 [Subdoligranulum sp.]|nr:hypothetical protein [Subdoligranulum sp.]
MIYTACPCHIQANAENDHRKLKWFFRRLSVIIAGMGKCRIKSGGAGRASASYFYYPRCRVRLSISVSAVRFSRAAAEGGIYGISKAIFLRVC